MNRANHFLLGEIRRLNELIIKLLNTTEASEAQAEAAYEKLDEVESVLTDTQRKKLGLPV